MWKRGDSRPGVDGGGRRPLGRRVTGSYAGQHGFALIVVIMVLLVASFLAANLIMEVRSELQIGHNFKQRIKGRFLAEAGINLSVFRKLDRPQNSEGTEYERFLEGYPYEEPWGEKGRIRYYLVNESGKIDLNTFPRELMVLFLAYHGLSEEEIDVVIDSLLDWRDPDDLHRLHGAESDTYQALDDPYIPRNGRFQNPWEFFLVQGTEPLRGKFSAREVFTVHNPRSRINFNSLTPPMLEFLTGGDQDKVAAYRLAQESLEGTTLLNRLQAMEILGEEQFLALQQFLVYGGGNNRYYTVMSIGEAGYDPAREVEREADQPPMHWPGVRLEVLFQWRGSSIKYLSWREMFT